MRKIIASLIALLLTAAVGSAYADTKPVEQISLYQQPDAKSAVAGTIAPGQAIMPIFTQGEWTKIADPSNGNVGWVSNATLQQYRMPQVKTITQSTTTPNGSGYKVMQFGGTMPFDQKQLDELMKNWQAQQGNMQRVFGQMLEQSAVNLEALAKEMQKQNFQFPMIVPLVVMPNNAPATTK